MKINVFYLCAVLFLSACSMKDGGTIPGTVDVTSLDGVSEIVFKEMDAYPAGLYSDVFSDVGYVALESTGNSVVGDIEKMAVTSNRDLVIFDYNNKSILLFDSIGKFKNRIGVFGHAQNEYIQPLDMVYDEHHNNVIVYDNAKKKLMYYDLTGNYLRSISLNEYISSFEVLDESHLVLYSGYRGESNTDINYNYKIIDTKGNVVREFAPYDDSMSQITMMPYAFHKNNGKLFCHIEGTPVVNEISLKEMKPICLINFGEYQLPNSYYMNGPKTYSEKVTNLEPNKARTDRFFQTDGFIVMTFVCRGDDPYMCKKMMITPKTQLSQPNYYMSLFNDLYGKQSSSSLVEVSNGKAYFVCNAASINTLARYPSNTNVAAVVAKEYKKDTKQLIAGVQSVYHNVAEVLERPTTSVIITNKEKELADSLSKSKNPIIQICTFKKVDEKCLSLLPD